MDIVIIFGKIVSLQFPIANQPPCDGMIAVISHATVSFQRLFPRDHLAAFRLCRTGSRDMDSPSFFHPDSTRARSRDADISPRQHAAWFFHPAEFPDKRRVYACRFAQFRRVRAELCERPGSVDKKPALRGFRRSVYRPRGWRQFRQACGMGKKRTQNGWAFFGSDRRGALPRPWR